MLDVVPTVEAPPPVRAGDIVAGKYRVERVLGVGAMGVVVAAMHVDLEERRALKFMLPSALGSADSMERFLREGRAAARLKSQHVAKVYDVGKLDDGAPYIVMEYLEGTDLRTALTRGRSLPIEDAVRYMLQVCEAMGEAHAAGIIHRDLKPGNLFVTTGVGGAPCMKVLDFGIAKIAPSSQSALGEEMTKATDLLGTPIYMPPEQMRSMRNVDCRSDIWALGAILYRMVTGRAAFSGDTMTAVCAAVMADDPTPPSVLRPEVPRELDRVILRCLEKKPDQRYGSVDELALALMPFQGEVMSRRGTVVAPALPEVESATQQWERPPMPPSAREGPHSTSRTPAWVNTNKGSARRRVPLGVIVVGLLALLGIGVVSGIRLLGGHSEAGALAATPAPTEAAPSVATAAPPPPAAELTTAPTASASAAPPSKPGAPAQGKPALKPPPAKPRSKAWGYD